MIRSRALGKMVLMTVLNGVYLTVARSGCVDISFYPILMLLYILGFNE